MDDTDTSTADGLLSIDSGLGPGTLVMTRLDGEDAISRCFLYRVEVVATVPDASVEALLGDPVTLWITSEGSGTRRPIHGHVRAVAGLGRDLHGHRRFELEVVPRLWFLSCTCDCRIFQDLSVPDILRTVFMEQGLTHFAFRIVQENYPRVDYCVQYEESALDFVSRLMEHLGLFYWHEHTADTHLLVIGDRNNATSRCDPPSVLLSPNPRAGDVQTLDFRSVFRPIDDNGPGSPHLIPMTGPEESNPQYSFSPTSLDFGTQQVGTSSPSQTVTVTSVGQIAEVYQNAAVSGANPSDFNITNMCSPLDIYRPGDTCQLVVTFVPQGSGARSATVVMSSSAPEPTPPLPGTVLTLTATGTAPATPMASVAPASISFPSQFVGTSGLPQNVTLTNTGSVAISIASIVASPADFGALPTCGASLAAGGSCSIGVFFDPTVSGARTGTLTITDSAANSPQTVALSGTGQDFSVAPPAAAPTATVKAGQTAVYMLNLAPGGGFSQQVTFTCAGAPAEASCVVSPNPAMLSGSSTTVTVSVSTTAKSLAIRLAPKFAPLGFVKYWTLALEFLLSGLILFWLLQRKEKRISIGYATVLLLASAFLTVSACGGGSSSGGGGGNPSVPGTTAGSYTLTVTATYTTGSSTLSHQTNLTLVVQ